MVGGEEARYIVKVLRLRLGDGVLLFDGSGKEYGGEIEKVSKDQVAVRIMGESCPLVESPLELILIQGIPKSEKMDLIVKGTTELGVSGIWPFFSSRTIPRWKDSTLSKKVSHWEKIALSAAQQSGRTRVPEVRAPLPFEDMVNEVDNLKDSFLKIVLWEEERERKIKDVLRGMPQPAGICFLIGPEGGFSPDEINCFKRKGCIPIHLGNRILRTETAGITLLSIIQYEWGDLG